MSTNSEFLVQKVEKAILCAESGATKLTERQLHLEGMSSKKVRIFLNEIVDVNTNYLEIGVWKGSTFISALYNNSPKFACAIDNFSLPNNPSKNFKENCAANNISNYTLFEDDGFSISLEQKKLLQDINVYFYDADHGELGSEKALTHFYDNLASEFIFIVDDWSHIPVQTGTRNGIRKTNLHIVKEWVLQGVEKRLQNTKPKMLKEDILWWNGLYVAVCKKQD
jgi:hypothetical protein